jgi:hypothetical protein
LDTWSTRVELDIVEQALRHLSPEERRALEAQTGC